MKTVCPHCGEPLPPGAISCRHCGSDAQTGWKEGSDFTDLETPDYDEIVEHEFGKPKKKWGMIIVAVIVAAAFALVFTGVLF
ncbi:MAG: zinc ribbon domain-containing protein [Fibrobacteraceae bacterium]